VPSRRDQITMSHDEVRAFLADRKVMQVATVNPSGRPHMVPLWFVPDGTELRGWTYAKSQKTRNLERDPRATVGIEEGVEYEDLRGVMLECDVAIERDTDKVAEFGLALLDRYAGGAAAAKEAFQEQAKKRVGLTFRPTRVVSWDHSKLGGSY
jgi:PPOX class probable F420-dependent enzyme